MKKIKISTVNVIELVNDNVTILKSFRDTKQGNRTAEILFHDIAMENVKNLVEEDIENALEEGLLESGTGHKNDRSFLLSFAGDTYAIARESERGE